MKKSSVALLALAGAVIFFVSFISPGSLPVTDPPQGIPDSVWYVLETSCYECHSSDGNGMAKAKLNLDKWDEYPSDKQVAKAKEICSQMQKGKMPPSKYRLHNPDAVPSPEALSRVCSWVRKTEK